MGTIENTRTTKQNFRSYLALSLYKVQNIRLLSELCPGGFWLNCPIVHVEYPLYLKSIYFHVFLRERDDEHCNRVFKTSKGCTAKVATTPAVKPAVDSTSEGERVLEVASLPSTGGKVRGMMIRLTKKNTACLTVILYSASNYYKRETRGSAMDGEIRG
jgi:hypothetical protein